MDGANSTNADVTAGAAGARAPERGSRAAVILGNDTVVAARPASPAQLMRACKAAGFDIVVPPSWGDELVAEAYLERLATCAEAVAIACNCERVRAVVSRTQADSSGREVSIAAPSVAAARYLRLTYGDSVLITYVGDCPSANDPEIDAAFTPAGFFASLERQGIALHAQPNDMPEGEAERWKRHRSLPGGIPALRWLARAPVDRVLREATSETVYRSYWTSRSRSKVLLDLADSARCACGANRAVVEECEAERSTTPIVVAPVGLDLVRSVSHQPAAGIKPESDVPNVIDPSPLASAVAASAASTLRVERGQPATVPPRRARPSGTTRAPEPRRGAVVAPRSANRGLMLAILPVVVLAVSTALGAVAYAVSSTNRLQARTAAGEPSATGEPAQTRTDTLTTPRAESAGMTAPTIAVDTARRSRADSVSAAARSNDSTTVRSDSASTSANARPRRRPQPDVVPGWLPQGRGSWPRADTNRARRDSSRVPPVKPDTMDGA